MKNISVIIINYNTADLTIKAMQALSMAEPNLALDYIVIDNNSRHPLNRDRLVNSANVQLILNKNNIGFARAVNQGIEIAKGEYILLLNSDVMMRTGVLTKLLVIMERSAHIGIIGPKMQYPNGRTQVSCGKFPTFFREFMRLSKLGQILPGGTLNDDNFFNKKYYQKAVPVDWVSGGCMLLRRATVSDVGLFDKNYFFGIEDVDYSYRAKQKGWQVIFNPSDSVIHYHGQSVGGRRSIARLKYERTGILYFLRKFKMQSNTAMKAIDTFYAAKIFILQILRLAA